jgi:hypothetical protein
MKTFFLVSVITAALLTGCGKQNSGKGTPGTNSVTGSTNSSLINAPLDYLSTAVKAQKDMTKTIDVSYLNQAIQLFNTQEGHYPKDLQELVPNYVAQLPTPPYGSKLDYDANSGTVKVVQ